VQDTALPAGELTTNIEGMCMHSPLMSELWATHFPLTRLLAARMLHSFTRGSVAVRIGSWVVIQSASVPGADAYACQICEIVQVFSSDASHIRMLASQCLLLNELCESTWMNVPEHNLTGKRMLIAVEAVSICELHALREGPLYRFPCIGFAHTRLVTSLVSYVS